MLTDRPPITASFSLRCEEVKQRILSVELRWSGLHSVPCSLWSGYSFDHQSFHATAIEKQKPKQKQRFFAEILLLSQQHWSAQLSSALTKTRQQKQSVCSPGGRALQGSCATLHSFIHKRGILPAKSVLALSLHPATSIIEGDYCRDLRQAPPHSPLQGVQSME